MVSICQCHTNITRSVTITASITWYVLSKLSYINLVISEVLPTVEEKKKRRIRHKGLTVNGSQNLVWSLHRQHVWMHHVIDAVKGTDASQDDSELWSLCWQHGCRRPAFHSNILHQYRLRRAETLLYDSCLMLLTSNPAIMKRESGCNVDDVGS